MNKKERINFLCTTSQKQRMQELAAENRKSLTDFILDRALSGDSIEYQQLKKKYEDALQAKEALLIEKADMLDEYYQGVANLKENHHQELNALRDKLEDKQAEERQLWHEEKQQLREQYKELQRNYDITYNALLWHSLPFYKKIGKRKELPNRED